MLIFWCISALLNITANYYYVSHSVYGKMRKDNTAPKVAYPWKIFSLIFCCFSQDRKEWLLCGCFFLISLAVEPYFIHLLRIEKPWLRKGSKHNSFSIERKQIKLYLTFKEPKGVWSPPIRIRLTLVLSEAILKEGLGVTFSEPSVLLMNDGKATVVIRD